MNNERALTPQETERLNKRAKMLSESFMWKKETPGRQARHSIRVNIGALIVWCVLIAVAFVIGSIVGVLPSVDEVIFALFLCVIAGAVVIVSFVAVRFIMSVRTARKPPVFIFYDDKLFYVDADEGFSVSDIPKIPAGEMIALRENARAATDGKTSKDIEAQLFYLNTIEKQLVSEDGETCMGCNNDMRKRLDITIIEDIVSVSEDTDGDVFTISHENGQGYIVDARCPMDEWKNLYKWLVYQIGEDD